MLACPHAAVSNKRQSRTRVKAACKHHMADTPCANRPMRHERGHPSRSASPAHKSNICTTPAARLPGGRARSHAWTPPPSRHVHATIRSTSEVPTLRFRFPAPMRVGNGALSRRCCFRRKSFRSHSAGGGEKGGAWHGPQKTCILKTTQHCAPAIRGPSLSCRPPRRASHLQISGRTPVAHMARGSLLHRASVGRHGQIHNGQRLSPFRVLHRGPAKGSTEHRIRASRAEPTELDAEIGLPQRLSTHKTSEFLPAEVE